MGAITGITLPTPIEWSKSEYSGNAADHINQLDELLLHTTGFKGITVSYLDLYLGALAEVVIETLDPRRKAIATYVLEHYSIGGADAVKQLFTDWLTFTPGPDPKVPAKVLTPADGGPGFFIECWDYIVNTEAGIVLANADTFKPWVTQFLNYHGDWINSTESTGTLEQWIAYGGSTEHPFDINDFEVPKPGSATGGFLSFNQFFLRNVAQKKAGHELRPLCGDEDWIVAPCDGGVFSLYPENVERNASDAAPKVDFNLPGKSNDPFNVKHALPSKYSERFVGGQLLDILLWFTDYHHFHAPVTGSVLDHGLYPGSYNYDFDNFDANHPFGPLPPSDGDRAGWYQKLAKHQRYYWIIETEQFGTIAMIAIGFWGVGSIINGLEDTAGDGSPIPVSKGQYMGHFGYGGSSIVLAFEADKKFDFKVGKTAPVRDADHPVLMKVRECLGTKG
jgi:phosphatidylserine decarboxylase